MRSKERYFADIRHAIRDFYRPGDCLRLVQQYRKPHKCEMCGGMVNIVNCYDLQNNRSGEVIVCGEKCIVQYAEVIAQMGQTPSIVFPYEYRAMAEKINQHRRDTVIVEGDDSEEYIYDPNDPRHPLPNIDNDEERELRAIADEEGVEVADLLNDESRDDDRYAPPGLEPEDMDWDSHDYE